VLVAAEGVLAGAILQLYESAVEHALEYSWYVYVLSGGGLMFVVCLAAAFYYYWCRQSADPDAPAAAGGGVWP